LKGGRRSLFESTIPTIA